jgi:hypothetical protein
VYLTEVTLPALPVLRTGVPVFLGPTAAGAAGGIVALDRPDELAASFGPPLPGTYLAAAVAAFFANGGTRCHVVSLDDPPAEDYRLEELGRGLASSESLDEPDLVCAPDVVRRRELDGAPLNVDTETVPITLQQAAVVAHCDRLGRIAVLDALPVAGVRDAIDQRARVLAAAASSGANAAIYHPWLVTVAGAMPPAGHVAGVIARSDAARGVHKAPANEEVVGVVGTQADVGTAEQEQLNPAGINCIRAFPGRGIRVWGARTLAAPPWSQLNVRRLFLTVAREIELILADTAFEPSDERLWARIRREVGAYLLQLYDAGAFAGPSPQESFYVKCDAETNPPDQQEQGATLTEIGIAAAQPYEFVVVRITNRPGGVDVTAPAPG